MNIPFQYLIVIQLVLAIINQFVGNSRVTEAVEEVKHWKWFDYITSILFLFAPLILMFQQTLMNNIPVAAIPFATVAFGMLSTFVNERRVNTATFETEPVDSP